MGVPHLRPIFHPGEGRAGARKRLSRAVVVLVVVVVVQGVTQFGTLLTTPVTFY